MICLDSDCIIDFLKNKPEAVSTLTTLKRYYKETFVTTEINKFEVMLGIYDKKKINEKELKVAKSFFASIDVLPFGEECGTEAARILGSLARKGRVINQNDALIAAVMRVNGCEKIVTRNARDFGRIPGVKVEDYSEN